MVSPLPSTEQTGIRAFDAKSIVAIVSAGEDKRGCVVPHQLSNYSPSDAELDELTAQLPDSWTRGLDGAVDALSGTPPGELGKKLPHHRERPSVARIYHVQRSPQFRFLTDAVYDPVAGAWPASEPWLERDAGFFVSSRDAVTPAHSDRHHNLLVQLSGSKEIGFVTPGTRAHAAALARSKPSMWLDEVPPGAETLELSAGSALYLPPFAIHWVRNLERTVAISCAWRSAETERAGEFHSANAALSRVGIPAVPLGGRTDGARLKIAATARRVSRCLHR